MGYEDQALLDLQELLPEEGMAVTIIRRGDCWQLVRHFLLETPSMRMLELTEEDIEALSRGEITFQ